VLGAVLLAGCSSSPSASPTATTVTGSPSPSATAGPTPTVTVDKGFFAFLQTVCGNLARGNASGISASLMHYQYNSGLRWGTLGDGLGRSDDPSLLNTWLAHARPHCVSYSSGQAQHGAVLTSGWSQPARWAIVEMDVVNGKWRINDFTFGPHRAMAQAMQIVAPTVPFHG
jgi:hypothetical protein